MEAIIARLQTPADNDGIRKDIHLMTDGEAVTVKSGNRTITLQDRLDEIGGGPVVSEDQPARECMWFQVKSEEEGPDPE